MKIAFLITCYNRINTTLKCLKKLNEEIHSLNYNDYDCDIFLVDDKSPDKTGIIVKKNYSRVNVIEGSGQLYWSGGMRLAWQTAVQYEEYDLYFWLNDDVKLFKNSVQTMLADLKSSKNSIVVGVFKSSDKNKTVITYGGRDKDHKLISPIGIPKNGVKYIEGNFVAIPKKVFKKLGYIDEFFTHTIGDSDYGLRAIKEKIPILISSKILGICDINVQEDWRKNDVSLYKRIKSFRNSKRFIIKEQMIFAYRDKGALGIFRLILSTFFLILSPLLYYRFRNVK